MNNTAHTVFVTGGHLTPAIATIEEISRRHPTWRVLFVGRTVALEGSTIESEEYRVITERGIPFLPISAGRLKRDSVLRALIALLKVPGGFMQALKYVQKEKPTLVMSFGGYVALPVVLAAWMYKVPVVTHEQTSRPGLANSIISHIAAKTCVTFPDTQSVGKQKTVVYTGLPMRSIVFSPPKKAPIPLPSMTKPILLVLGGATGAKTLNEIVYSALPALLHNYTVVHQVGRVSEGLAKQVRSRLGAVKGGYIPLPYISEETYSYFLHNASVIVSRSGANTVMEIAAVGKVAVFVPLPWAANNEQYHNAQFLGLKGSAIVCDQNNLTPQILVRDVATLEKNRSTYETHAKDVAAHIPRDGAYKLVSVLDDVIG